MSSNRDFEIQFEGLKLGKHSFEFKVTDEFFANLEYSLVEYGNLNVLFTLDKKETMMIGEVSLDGYIKHPCDRCTETMKVPINGNLEVFYKFGTEESEDENLIMIGPSEFKINITPIIHELISILLPTRVIHKKGACNEEMLALLNEYSGFRREDDDDSDDGFIDPRWNKLKDLN